MISLFDMMHDERHYGYILDKRYDWLNLLTKLEKNNPRRFREFKYSKQTMYHYLDRISQEQNIYD